VQRSGVVIRAIATSILGATLDQLYELYYCSRVQAENPSKLHKIQLGSDRTSCVNTTAYQNWLIWHTVTIGSFGRSFMQFTELKDNSGYLSSRSCEPNSVTNIIMHIYAH
jgi:hypothetical protein